MRALSRNNRYLERIGKKKIYPNKKVTAGKPL